MAVQAVLVICMLLAGAVWLVMSSAKRVSQPAQIETPRNQNPIANQTPRFYTGSVPLTNPGKVHVEPETIAKTNIPVDLFKGLMSGDQGAKQKMIAIAGDGTYDLGERCQAVSMLAQEGSKTSLAGVMEMLKAKEGPIRRTAYYSLPQGLRIPNYDYHAEPSLLSKRAIDAAVAKLTSS